MTTLTNSFHNSQITIRSNVGDTVSRRTLQRVRKALCGIEGCTCGLADGTRDSRYRLDPDTLVVFRCAVPGRVIDDRKDSNMKLRGHEAITYAEAHGLRLAKYADPVEDARQDLTPEEARKIAREDPRLIYLDIE